jgi:hypothetical protein
MWILHYAILFMKVNSSLQKNWHLLAFRKKGTPTHKPQKL